MQKITPFLWYDGDVADAVAFYRSIFPNSKLLESAPGPGGTLMSATFELEGQRLIAFNGGPHLKFSPAISMFVSCIDQAEVDTLWARLSDGGSEGQCGWLQDRFGLSWQIIPTILPKLFGDADREAAGRAMQAMMQMQKIDVAALQRAFSGG